MSAHKARTNSENSGSDQEEPVEPSHDDRLAVSPKEAARLAGIGRTFLYEAISSGALKTLKLGKRRLIPLAALQAWLATHEVHP